MKELDELNLKNINMTVLAYLGDGVYEAAVRERLVCLGMNDADGLHKRTVLCVRAENQARAVKAIMESLTEDELDIVKRARNRKTISKPKNLDPVTYKYATAFEALVGYLYIKDREKLAKIVELAMRLAEEGNVKNERKAATKE